MRIPSLVIIIGIPSNRLIPNSLYPFNTLEGGFPSKLLGLIGFNSPLGLLLIIFPKIGNSLLTVGSDLRLAGLMVFSLGGRVLLIEEDLY